MDGPVSCARWSPASVEGVGVAPVVSLGVAERSGSFQNRATSLLVVAARTPLLPVALIAVAGFKFVSCAGLALEAT